MRISRQHPPENGQTVSRQGECPSGSNHASRGRLDWVAEDQQENSGASGFTGLDTAWLYPRSARHPSWETAAGELPSMRLSRPCSLGPMRTVRRRSTTIRFVRWREAQGIGSKEILPNTSYYIQEQCRQNRNRDLATPDAFPAFPRWVLEGTSLYEGLAKPVADASSKFPELIWMPAMMLLLELCVAQSQRGLQQYLEPLSRYCRPEWHVQIVFVRVGDGVLRVRELTCPIRRYSTVCRRQNNYRNTRLC